MSNETRGHFYVGEIDEGRFVAAARSAPYFCFRGTSEDEVVSKARRALRFWKQRTVAGDVHVSIKSVSRTITTVHPQRKLSFNEVLDAEAA